MANVYEDFYPVFNEEKDNLDDRLVNVKRQDRGPTVQAQLAVVGVLLGLGLFASNILQPPEPRQQLEDHPMCGVTTGGKVGGWGRYLIKKLDKHVLCDAY